MHNSVKNLLDIQDKIKFKTKATPIIIAVSKTFEQRQILPLLEYGHIHFGENKVQEALEKWTEVKSKNSNIKLHMIGKLQTNKVKFAVKLFDFIHSVENEKLAKKIAEEQLKLKKKIKIFIQVNVGNESQKSGINSNNISNFLNYCENLDLEVVGLMCIPPESSDSKVFFEQMNELTKKYNLKELSMGMSSDYLKAAQLNSTYLRIGSSIFGQRL